VNGGVRMAIMKIMNKSIQFKLTVLMAALFLIIGFGIWAYTTSVIQGHSQLLSSADLTQEELWSYEGAFQWWTNTYSITVLPLTTIMITAGFVTLLGPTVLTRMHKRNALKTFADKLELASTEKFEIEFE